MRSSLQKAIDTITFPFRALTLFEEDRFGLSSLATERFDYVARHVRGHCLDLGCGRHDRFIQNHLGGKGVGIDVFAYEGLTPDQIVEDPTDLPFPDGSFATVTLIANFNHIPEPVRDPELAEVFRVLEPGGNVIITMGNPLAEILVHKLVEGYDRVLGTNIDMDGERGMHEDEDFFVPNREIAERLGRAGFTGSELHYFGTQWGLNHLMIGTKP